MMKPSERALYRLSPEDEVLERKVNLSTCSIWVPVIPDASVLGEDPPMNWRRWMFEFAHPQHSVHIELGANLSKSFEEWDGGKRLRPTSISGTQAVKHARNTSPKQFFRQCGAP